MSGAQLVRSGSRRVLLAGAIWVCHAIGDGLGLGASGAIPTHGAAETLGTVVVKDLKEASGLAASRRASGVLWTHNDGPRGTLFALDYRGAHLATVTLEAEVEDVEDLAMGPGPEPEVSYLYLGDIGGSRADGGARREVRIVRVAEPAVNRGWADRPAVMKSAAASFVLEYPDGGFDAESLLVDPRSGEVFVVTKQEGFARVYRAALSPASPPAPGRLEFVRQVPFSLASAGDISDDGTQIALRREGFAMLWTRGAGETVGDALGRAGVEIPVVGPPGEPNGEALAWVENGLGYVTLSEGASPSLYFFPALRPGPPAFLSPPADASAFAGGSASFDALAGGYPRPAYRWSKDGVTLPSGGSAGLNLPRVVPTQAGIYTVTASNAWGAVASQATLTVRPKPDLRITEAMTVPAPGAGVATAGWWELTSFETQPVVVTGWRVGPGEGGLAGAFAIEDDWEIAPGESVVFVEGLTAGKFRKWWGKDNLPSGLRIVRVDDAGLGLGAGPGELRVWSDLAADAADWVAAAAFGAATPGVSFSYDPGTGAFGGLSALGVNGALQAAASADIGSPGRVVAPIQPVEPRVRWDRGRLRVEFQALAGHRYALEASEGLGPAVWTGAVDSLSATTNGPLGFMLEITGARRFYRVRAD